MNQIFLKKLRKSWEKGWNNRNINFSLKIGVENYASTSRIAEESDISTANTSAVIRNLKEKIDLDINTEGKKKLHRLSEAEKEKIFQIDEI